MSAENKKFLEDLPTQNKDNFKIYHDSATSAFNTKQTGLHPPRILLCTTPSDTTRDARDLIVNERKPEVTSKYLLVRSGQYSNQSQTERNMAKRKRSNGVKVQQ